MSKTVNVDVFNSLQKKMLKILKEYEKNHDDYHEGIEQFLEDLNEVLFFDSDQDVFFVKSDKLKDIRSIINDAFAFVEDNI